MDRYFILWCISLGLFACKEESKYTGFSLTKTGLNYQIHVLGDPYESLHDSDYISYKETIYSRTGEEIKAVEFHQEVQYFSSYDTGLIEFLGVLNIGDSGVFVTYENDVELLHGIKLVNRIRIKEKEILALLDSLPSSISSQERSTIGQLLVPYIGDSIQFKDGIYWIQQISGSGDFPVTGTEVIFHMEGRNSRGKLIESTWKVNRPFSFFLGDQEQVLPGLEIGIRQMRPGGKAILIVPSQLAYGKKGSNTGIVKPNEPLVYCIDYL